MLRTLTIFAVFLVGCHVAPDVAPGYPITPLHSAKSYDINWEYGGRTFPEWQGDCPNGTFWECLYELGFIDDCFVGESSL